MKTIKYKTIETDEDIKAGLRALALVCPVMARLIKETPTVPLRRVKPGFASLASIIISQQVSKQSAAAIYGRMENMIVPLTAENYLVSGETVWQAIGLSRPKQKTFYALCEAIMHGTMLLDELVMLNAEDAISYMTHVKGIGPWTAQVYLLSAVGHVDVFPAGDLALQQAVADAYGLPERPSDKVLREKAHKWSPWRSVAARLLWAYYGNARGRHVMP